ncbi:hypothetical protein C8A00DRAFT_29684 [Chaetomidium leptoderma]|uniref:Uncharacterized protein n=1 Tax=Chaetomidium leptoderma TaxID=669021 RepID=A0AAN6VVQ3_9PEZI|nr:hypothetical protein C8A00DRAFT_29684 [Chaetomidium leptoderma]
MGLFSRHAEPAHQPAPQHQQPVYEEPPRKHGLFSSKQEPVSQQPAYEEPNKKHGLFSSSRQEPAVPQQPAYDYEEPPKKHGLFGSRRHSPTRSTATHGTRSTASMSPDRDRSSSGGGDGIFRRSTDAGRNGTNVGSQRNGRLHRSFGNGNGHSSEMDPSIMQAQERLMGAEAAEAEADRALIAARESVREAHEHVRRLEVEAKEEARLAKIKEHHAKAFSKRGKQLGRHDY